MNLPDAPSPVVSIAPEDAGSPAARQLIDALVTGLRERYGAAVSPFAPSETAEPRTIFLVARLGREPVGCGGLRALDDATSEIKRVYVAPAARRRGIARLLLSALERTAAEFGYRTLRLETGIYQTEAMALYDSAGYRRIPPFGRYVGNPISVCYEKVLGVD